MNNRRLLVLDVEGTIITGYNFKKVLPDSKHPAVIDKKLKNLLKQFADAEFDIVLATGTSGDNLAYYESEFTKAGINQYIKSYAPVDHSDADSKADKIRKYVKEYQLLEVDDVYFFDDAENNITAAKKAGFGNSYQVTEENNLVNQLTRLAEILKLNTKKHLVQSSLFRSVDETNPLLNPDEKPESCCACVIF